MSDLTSLVITHTDVAPVLLTPVSAEAFDDWSGRQSDYVRTWATAQGFKAAAGQALILAAPDGSIAEVIIGVDTPPKVATAAIWWLAGAPAILPAGHYRLRDDLDPALVEAAAVGWALSQYGFDHYKSNPAEKKHFLVLGEEADIDCIHRTITAISHARDLINTPAEHMGPPELEGAVRQMGAQFGATVMTITGDALLEHNFPTIHLVGRAAEKAPRLIDLAWGKADDPKVTLVGKGVCFDTGGLDIKAAPYMRQMKKDMGGAAHAIALAHMIMASGMPVRLRLLIPAVENAISGNAMRPGDVVTTRQGISVEVGNTDAEGRLVLCDALTYASEEEPDMLLDFATLTGAARVALGPDLPATFTDDEAFWALLHQASDHTGDPLWRLPLWKPYLDSMKSDIADTDNIAGDAFAGAITAALYLQRFTEGAGSWTHFDVFGWQPKPAPGRPKGGAVQVIRAAFEAIRQHFNLS